MTSSAELLRRNGYAGTGLKRIAAEADAPRVDLPLLPRRQRAARRRVDPRVRGDLRRPLRRDHGSGSRT